MSSALSPASCSHCGKEKKGKGVNNENWQRHLKACSAKVRHHPNTSPNEPYVNVISKFFVPKRQSQAQDSNSEDDGEGTSASAKRPRNASSEVINSENRHLVNCLTNGLKSGNNLPVKPIFDATLPQPKRILFPPENVVLGWTDKASKEAGMENLGNTCYINSILQALFHVPAFVNWLLSDCKHREKCEQENGPTYADSVCLTCALAETLLATRNQDIIRPELITNKRRMIRQGFENGSQEDAHEFMRCLLDNVEKGFLNRFPQEMLDSYSRETTPINQIFGGYLRSEVACQNCGSVSTSFQHFQDLLLDIRLATKIDEALDLHFGKEILDGPNAYRCESCKQLSKATKSFSIEKPPKVLCIQLKRFTGGRANKKISKKVEVKRHVNLQRHMHAASQHPPNSSLEYELIATVSHEGNGPNEGHYTAIAKTSLGLGTVTYCLFNDETVRQLSSDPDHSGAYILLFEQIDLVSRISNDIADLEDSGRSSSRHESSSLPVVLRETCDGNRLQKKNLQEADGMKKCVTANVYRGSNPKRTYLSGSEKKKKARLAELQRASQCPEQSKLPFAFYSARRNVDVETHMVVSVDPCSVTLTANDSPAKEIEPVRCEEERTEETPHSEDIADSNSNPMAIKSKHDSDISSGGIEGVNIKLPSVPVQNLNQPDPSFSTEQMEVQEQSFNTKTVEEQNIQNDFDLQSICSQSTNTSQEVIGSHEHVTCEMANAVQDPFECLLLERLDLNEDEKKMVIRVHPVQPESKPSQTIKLPFDKERIYFRRDGGGRRLWTSYCHVRRKIFCWVCRAFGKATGTISSFVTGWGNEALWKAGACYRAADVHENSDEHGGAIDAFFKFANDRSIQMSSNANTYTLRKKQVTQRREIFIRIINIVLFLGRQGIALRGSGNEAAYSIPDTSNHGNFLEMIKCQAVFDPVLADYVDKVVKKSQARHDKHPNSQGRGALTTFLSKSTLNSLLKVIGDMIQSYIVQQVIENGGKYSLCIDSTQDISVKEQTSIVVRYVDEYGPVEKLLDVVETPETTGQALHDHTVDVLQTLGLALVGGLLGYSLDGASNMSGRIKGLQALLKATVPDSVYQHCYAHKLQLVMEKCCTCIPEAVTFFDLLRESPIMISESHKRMQLWKDVVLMVFPEEPKSSTKFMVKLSKTRWWAKCKALKRILTSDKSILPVIIVVLLLLSEDPEIPAQIRAKARGSALSWCSFETLAVGVMFLKIFSLSESVSQYLQDKNLDHVQAARMTSNLIASVAAIDIESALTESKTVAMSCNKVLEKLNSSDAFVEKFGELDVMVSTEAVRRRVPVVPRKCGEIAGDDSRRWFESQPPESYLRIKVLIPIHDRCLSELKARFEGDSEATFKACSFLSPRWFEEIVEKGIPQGALRPLCCLADVDEVEAENQLVEFAKNYKSLTKTIQADFRPGPQECDFTESDEGCESEDLTVENSGEASAQDKSSPKCKSEYDCQGCLRCSYRILKKHGLYSTAYQAVWKLYKCALTLPCTQITCERCFSKLKIVKNRLRNSMLQENLKSSLLMSVERDITYKLDLQEVLENFAKTSPERSKLLLY